MDWRAIVEWSGYDLLGLLVSIFGGAYAFIANKNAKKASDTAARAVSNVTMFDTVTELGKMLQTMTAMRRHVEDNDFHKLSSSGSEIYLSLVRIVNSRSIILSLGARESLGELKSGISDIIDFADRNVHRDKVENILPLLDPVKLKSMISRTEETIVVVQTELAEKVRSNE